MENAKVFSISGGSMFAVAKMGLNFDFRFEPNLAVFVFGSVDARVQLCKLAARSFTDIDTAADELVFAYLSTVKVFCESYQLTPFVSAICPAADVSDEDNSRFEWRSGSVADTIQRTNLLNNRLYSTCVKNSIMFFDPYSHVRIAEGQLDAAKCDDVVHVHPDHWPDIHQSFLQASTK